LYFLFFFFFLTCFIFSIELKLNLDYFIINTILYDVNKTKQNVGRFDADRRWHLVVFHAHHHLVVHGQFGRFPHRRADDRTHRFRRRFSRPKRYLLRHPRGWLYNDLLQGNHFFFKIQTKENKCSLFSCTHFCLHNKCVRLRSVKCCSRCLFQS